jgi:hypothetical protein
MYVKTAIFLMTVLFVCGCKSRGAVGIQPCKDEVLTLRCSRQECRYPGARMEKVGSDFICHCPGSTPATSDSASASASPE